MRQDRSAEVDELIKDFAECSMRAVAILAASIYSNGVAHPVSHMEVIDFAKRIEEYVRSGK